ncbi:MAG: L,D-transpeptidase [Devosia sp.]
MTAALFAAFAPPSALAQNLTLSDVVLHQERSRLALPEAAAPVFENSRERIVVDMKKRRLFMRLEDGEVALYRVGIGRPEAHIPLGRTRVSGKRVDPSWWPTPRARKRDPFLPEVMEAGGNNPLGSRAMNLSWKYYLIHGTNDPAKIGRAATWGCVSLYESEVTDFFDLVARGTRARFEPTLQIKVGHGDPLGADRRAVADAGNS